MEKNRIHPIKSGKSSRMSYSRQKEVLQMPNLIEVQKESYEWFRQNRDVVMRRPYAEYIDANI